MDVHDQIQQMTSVVDAQALAATVQFLTTQSSHKLNFEPSRLLLSSSSQPSQQIQIYLYQVAQDAQAAAFRTMSCSSLLVGQGNESDENSDVAFWVGQGEFGIAENVLQALGFCGDIELVELPLSPELETGLQSMDDKYSFRVKANDSRVIIFLVGKMEEGWGGLVGVGVWT